MFGDLMGVFVNLITRFQIYAITLKSLVAKMVAVVVVNMYNIEAAVLTLSSAWKGPMGATIRGLASF